MGSNSGSEVMETNCPLCPIIPNEETIAAMEAAERGELKSFDTIEQLMAHLNNLDCEEDEA